MLFIYSQQRRKHSHQMLLFEFLNLLLYQLFFRLGCRSCHWPHKASLKGSKSPNGSYPTRATGFRRGCRSRLDTRPWPQGLVTNLNAIMLNCIQYIIIVFKGAISGTRAARGLKFWLQVALGSLIKPWGRGTDPGSPGPEIRIFRKSGFFGFWCLSTDSLSTDLPLKQI